MKIFSANIPTSLGDILIIKAHLDAVKKNYDQINITFHTQLWKEAITINAEQEQQWKNYISDLGKLFFSEPPYRLNVGQYPFMATATVIQQLQITPIRVDLRHLLCKGESLNIGDYIVITTKVRGLNRNNFLPKTIHLWKPLREINKNYKIVILGEREVEMRNEYTIPQVKNTIFSIYNHIICNLSSDNILDLTIPALGNTQSTVKQIQQDCLIMSEAKMVIALGTGGNVGMSSACGDNILGYREDDSKLGDQLYYGTSITKDWNQFLKLLGRHL